MNRIPSLLSILLMMIISMAQVGGAFAAPASQEATPIRGTVQSMTLDLNPTTGVVTIIVHLMDSNLTPQTVRLSQESATVLGFVLLDADGNPVLNEAALGAAAEIDPTMVIPEQEKKQNPVGNALATFFSEIDGIDYDTIMSAHEDGVGFGVIAQALWLTSELGGDSQVFQDLIYAKQHNDYSAFSDFTEDGTTPKNWGQLRNALLSKKNLGLVMSGHDDHGNPGNGNANSQNANKDQNQKKEKSNNGHGNGNADNGKGNGNGNTK